MNADAYRAALVWAMQNARSCIEGASEPGGFSLWSVPEEHKEIMQAAHDLAFTSAKGVTK